MSKISDVFYEEAFKNDGVWSIKDSNGFPSPKNSDGYRAQPFWSSYEKALESLEKNSNYQQFSITKIDLNDFLLKWIPGLEKDKIKVGINWAGSNMRGFDVFPNEALSNFQKLKAINNQGV